MKEIYLDESEEKLTVDEIQSFEKKIGKIFPNDFKKFLLKSNGGYPREELFTHPFIEINPNTNIVPWSSSGTRPVFIDLNISHETNTNPPKIKREINEYLIVFLTKNE